MDRRCFLLACIGQLVLTVYSAGKTAPITENTPDQTLLSEYESVFAAFEKNLDPVIPQEIALENVQRLSQKRMELEKVIRERVIKNGDEMVKSVFKEVEKSKSGEQSPKIEYLTNLIDLLLLRDRCEILIKIINDSEASSPLRVKELEHLALISTVVKEERRKSFGLGNKKIKRLLAKLVMRREKSTPELEKTAMKILTGRIRSSGLEDQVLALELRRQAK